MKAAIVLRIAGVKEATMTQVNMHEAKTHLSSLVKKASLGEAFVIAISGKPMVTVVPYSAPAGSRKRIGFLRGQGRVPEDFDAMGAPEIEALFG
jgi:antitoxin (DNA-binding transcriptional repressor) of toxin-antitoxin stability system